MKKDQIISRIFKFKVLFTLTCTYHDFLSPEWTNDFVFPRIFVPNVGVYECPDPSILFTFLSRSVTGTPSSVPDGTSLQGSGSLSSSSYIEPVGWSDETDIHLNRTPDGQIPGAKF